MNKSRQSGNSSFQDESKVPPKVHHYEGFWAKTCMILGAVHVIVAVLCFIMNGIGISFHAHLHNYAQGMWGGAVFFITGFICVFAGFSRTPIPVKLAMAASIATIVVAIPIMGITAAGLDHDRKINFSYWIKDDYYGKDYLDGKESFRKSAHAMLLALSLLELIVGSLTLAVTVHAIFYCNSYKGANQSSGSAMMFPKSTSPVPPEINMSSNQPLPGVPGNRYSNHDTSTASDGKTYPMNMGSSPTQGGNPDVSRASSHREEAGPGVEPGVQPGMNSSGPSAFKQYPGAAPQPQPASNQFQPIPAQEAAPVTAPKASSTIPGSRRGPPQPQAIHSRHDTSVSSAASTSGPPKKKGPQLQVQHNRHDMSTSSVETTGSRKKGPTIQQPHQRHDMSYSSVDSYPSVQGGIGYPPPDRTSSRSSNPGPYPQYGGGGMLPPSRALEGYSQPGYPPSSGQYPHHQQRRV